MKLLSMLGGLLANSGTTETTEKVYENGKFVNDWAWLQQILDVLNMIIFPILIVVASVGTIYAIYLGVMMAKAENAEKREEAKKRIINAVIAVAVMIVLILLLKLFTEYAPGILGINKDTGLPFEKDPTKKDSGSNGQNPTGGIIGLLKFMMMK